VLAVVVLMISSVRFGLYGPVCCVRGGMHVTILLHWRLIGHAFIMPIEIDSPSLSMTCNEQFLVFNQCRCAA